MLVLTLNCAGSHKPTLFGHECMFTMNFNWNLGHAVDGKLNWSPTELEYVEVWIVQLSNTSAQQQHNTANNKSGKGLS